VTAVNNNFENISKFKCGMEKYEIGLGVHSGNYIFSKTPLEYLKKIKIGRLCVDSTHKNSESYLLRI
jgi:hypothetical protein